MAGNTGATALSEKLKGSRESNEARLQRYEGYFALDDDTLKGLFAAFHDELTVGLRAHRDAQHGWDPSVCSFKMLDSCIRRVADGDETGVFYGLDFGGTNFRAVRVELKGTGDLKMDEEKSVVAGTDWMAASTTATELFDFFANSVKSLMTAKGDLAAGASPSTRRAAGFTFSFPCTQRKLDSATLVEWTKGWETGRGTDDRVENVDVALLMDAAFRRNAVPVAVKAVLNDTVGTLLSASYSIDRSRQHPCMVGVILGTGTNVCYYETLAPEFGYKGKIINVECGNFDKQLPLTNVDQEVDFAATANRGKQLFEKMLSGAYLGELCRRAIVKVLQHRAPENAWIPYTLETKTCADLWDMREAGKPEADKLIYEIAFGLWGVDLDADPYGPEILMTVGRVVDMVFRRSAALAAVMIAATAKKTGKLQPAMGGLSVAVDGSLYRCITAYRRVLGETLVRILGPHVAQLIQIVISNDGSGKGAAILAATESC